MYTVNTTTVVVLFCNFVYDVLNCYKMWAIPTGTNSVLKKTYSGKESQYMVSRLELGSDPPNGSDRDSGRDNDLIVSTATIYIVTALINGRDIICSRDLICSVFLQC